MKVRSSSSRFLSLALFPALLLSFAPACGDDGGSSDDPGVEGGEGGTTAGKGGASNGGTGNRGGSSGGSISEGGTPSEGGAPSSEGGSPGEGGTPGTGEGGAPSEGGAGGAGPQPTPTARFTVVFDSAGVVASSEHFKLIATLGEGLGSAASPGESAQLSSENYRLATGVTVSVE